MGSEVHSLMLKALSTCYHHGALSLIKVIQLSTSSKQCKQLCLSLIRGNAHRQLLAAVADIKHQCAQFLTRPISVTDEVNKQWHLQHGLADCQLLDRLKSSLRWLLAGLPPTAAAAPATAAALINTPTVPLFAAAMLVQAGVRISYMQLVDAARERVQGVEVWVEAQQQLGVVKNIPPAATAICSYAVHLLRGERVLVLMQQLHPERDFRLEDMPDLCIAFNCSAPFTATGLAQKLLLAGQQHFNATLALELLTTAAIRGHVDAAARLTCSAAAMKLTIEQVGAVIQAALAAFPDHGRSDELLSALSALPGYMQLSPSTLSDCLRAAVQQMDSASVDFLAQNGQCEPMPAVVQISPQLLLQLLHQCLVRCDWQTALSLCRWPAAARFTEADMVLLLTKAAQRRVTWLAVAALQQQPAATPAAAISPEARRRLLLMVMHNRDMDGLQHLQRLPEAPTTQCAILPADIMQLLLAGINTAACDMVHALCKQQAAARLGPASIAELLLAAVKAGCSVCVSAVLELEAVLGQQLTAGAAVQVQQALAEAGLHPVVGAQLQQRLACRQRCSVAH